MLKRALGILKNLGNWAKANTQKIFLAKLKKGRKKDDKENVSVVSTLDSNDTHLKEDLNLNGTVSTDEDSQSQSEKPIIDTSNTHSHLHHDVTREIPHVLELASDHVSMHDGRLVGSFQNEINKLRCREDVEITGNKPEIDPRILNDTAGTIFMDMSGIDDEMESQIDMCVGCTNHSDTMTDLEEGDTTDASRDNEDQQLGHWAGLSWDKRKPPTETVALEALRVIQDLLCPPHGGKWKGYKEPKVNGWSKRHLQEIGTTLNLYTGEWSKVKSLWMAASAQAAQAHRQKPGHARSLGSHAKKFVELCTVPVTCLVLGQNLGSRQMRNSHKTSISIYRALGSMSKHMT